MPGPLHFRSARAGDEAQVQALVFDVLGEFGLTPDPSTTDADLQDLQANYLRPGGWFEVLVDDADRIFGTVGLAVHGPHKLELRKMYLHPSVRGQGYGRAALERAIAFARARGFVRVELETNSVLTAAIALYRAYGFKHDEAAPSGARCDGTMVLDL